MNNDFIYTSLSELPVIDMTVTFTNPAILDEIFSIPNGAIVSGIEIIYSSRRNRAIFESLRGPKNNWIIEGF